MCKLRAGQKSCRKCPARNYCTEKKKPVRKKFETSKKKQKQQLTKEK